MCMNCGCGIPNDDMGNPKNIVFINDILDRVKETAPENGNTVIEELKNVEQLLHKLIHEMEEKGETA